MAKCNFFENGLCENPLTMVSCRGENREGCPFRNFVALKQSFANLAKTKVKEFISLKGVIKFLEDLYRDLSDPYYAIFPILEYCKNCNHNAKYSISGETDELKPSGLSDTGMADFILEISVKEGEVQSFCFGYCSCQNHIVYITYVPEKNVFSLYSLKEDIELPPYEHTQFQDVCELSGASTG